MSRPREEVPTAWQDGKIGYSLELKLDTAKAMLEAAEIEAKRQGVSMTFVITGCGGNMMAMHRMEYAPLYTIQIASNKAYTAVFGKLPSQYWQGVFASGVLPNLPFHDNWSAFAGGFPLIRGNQILGGLGVSGGVLPHDLAVARVAIAAGGFELGDVEAALKEIGELPVGG